MATKTKTAVKKKKVVKELPFGISHLAKELGVEVPTARMKCREAKIPKAGKSYGWPTQAELKKVANKLAA